MVSRLLYIHHRISASLGSSNYWFRQNITRHEKDSSRIYLAMVGVGVRPSSPGPYVVVTTFR